MWKIFTKIVKTKQQLVVFTVFLLVIIITTLALAYYVHNRANDTENKQKLNWLSIIDYFNEMSICIENPSLLLAKNVNQLVDNTDIIMLASIKAPAGSKPTILTGFISLKDWPKRCSSDTVTPDYLEVSLILPKNDLEKPLEQNVCVKIKGLSCFMPVVTKSPTCNTTNKEINKEILRSTMSFNKASEISCPNSTGTLSVLKFDQKNAELSSNEYLSEEDYSNINPYIIITCFSLIAIVVLIAGFSICNKKCTTNDTATLSSVLRCSTC